jgi:hypothetical protein
MLGLGLFLFTNEPQQTPTFKTEVTVVNVPVTVRGHGILVKDLDRASFFSRSAFGTVSNMRSALLIRWGERWVMRRTAVVNEVSCSNAAR